MKEIELSRRGKNKGKYVALVDDEDYEYLSQFRWNAHKGKNTFYAARRITVAGKQTTQYMHCEIIKGKGIDHIDGDGLRNTRSNLRLCTNSENNMNRKKHKNKSSTYKGVSFYKRDNNWLASIRINNKGIYLGYFDTEIDAAKAYNERAAELFGEFANLNNIN